MATVITTTAVLSLKELKSIIELSLAGRARTGNNANRHYRRRGANVEAIICIAVAGHSRHVSVAQWREGFSQDDAMEGGIVSSVVGVHIKLC